MTIDQSAAEAMAESYRNGNITTVHEWVGNSAARLCAILPHLEGSDEQRRFILSYRIYKKLV